MNKEGIRFADDLALRVKRIGGIYTVTLLPKIGVLRQKDADFYVACSWDHYQEETKEKQLICASQSVKPRKIGRSSDGALRAESAPCLSRPLFCTPSRETATGLFGERFCFWKTVVELLPLAPKDLQRYNKNRKDQGREKPQRLTTRRMPYGTTWIQ